MARWGTPLPFIPLSEFPKPAQMILLNERTCLARAKAARERDLSLGQFIQAQMGHFSLAPKATEATPANGRKTTLSDGG